jgi:hypothetical protein
VSPFQTPSVSSIDFKAIRRVRLFAIVLIVSYVPVLAVGFLFSAELNAFRSSIESVTTSGGLPIPPVATFTNSLEALAISGAIYLFGLYLLRAGFKTLTLVDDNSFGWASLLTLALILEVPVNLVGIAAVVFGSGDVMFAGTLVLVVGVLTSFLFFIGGPILGLWKIGVRYNDSTLKVAAILLVIPIPGFSCVSAILVIVGLDDVKHQVRLATSKTGMDSQLLKIQ